MRVSTIRTARIGAAVVLLAAAAASTAPAQQRTEPVITLEEAIDRALLTSPTMVQRLGAVQTATSAERTAIGSFIPNLSMSSGASLASTERFSPETNTTVTGSNDSYNAGLSASVDLFTAGRRTAQLRQARSQTDVAEFAVIEQRFAVVLAAKRSFFEVLRQDELVRAADKRVERAQQGLQAAEVRLAVGSGTRSDSLRSMLELNQARQAQLQAQSNRRAAAFTLGALVGYDGPVGAEQDVPLEPQPLDLSEEQLLDLAVGRSPSVATAEAAVRSNEASLRVARSQYFPTIRLSGGYNWFNQDASLSGGRLSWSTGVSLSYPIFNGFNREDQNERASVNLRVARAQLEDARRQARTNLDRVLTNLRLAEAQIALARVALEVAEEDLRVIESRYTLGAGTILDLISSQIALVEAENALIAARYDYQLARADLEALIGREL